MQEAKLDFPGTMTCTLWNSETLAAVINEIGGKTNART